MVKKEKPDYILLTVWILIIIFGLVMLFSASSYTSINRYQDSMYFVKRQIRALLLGLLPMVCFSFMDYHKLMKYALPAYIVSMLLCCLVLVPGLGRNSHGSSRWLNLGPLSFQPSELAKIAVILFFALLIQKQTKMAILYLLPMGAIVAYTNLSTGVIIIGIAGSMFFMTSRSYFKFVLMFLLGIAGAILFVKMQGYRGDRITAWLHPDTAGDKGYQTLQGLYAIASGGWFGKGLGNSYQKLGNVPETQNDMIFTIICEELGAFGAIALILLYVLLLWRMYIIANQAYDLFGTMLVIGIMAHIVLQVVLNISVVTNTIPNTGVTLPFVSYGGTSIVFLMSEIGIVLSVQRMKGYK